MATKADVEPLTRPLTQENTVPKKSDYETQLLKIEAAIKKGSEEKQIFTTRLPIAVSADLLRDCVRTGEQPATRLATAVEKYYTIENHGLMMELADHECRLLDGLSERYRKTREEVIKFVINNLYQQTLELMEKQKTGIESFLQELKVG